MKGQGKIFYGWWMVALCLVLNVLVAGMTFYAVGLIAEAMQREFDTTRTIIMLGVTGHYLVMGLFAPKLSALMDRITVRVVMMGAAVISGIGYLLVSVTPSVWGFVGAFGLLVPVLTGVTTVLLCPILLSRWFEKYRGTAIGTAALGTQLGGFLFPPLIALVFETLGWRVGVAAMGVVMLTLIPLLVWLLMVEDPARLGLHPDGRDGDRSISPNLRDMPDFATSADALFRKAMGQREFWIASFTITLMFCVFGFWLSNIVLFAADVGVARDHAAFLVSLFAMVGMVSSPVVGWLCDNVPIRLVIGLAMGLIMTAMLIYSAADSYLWLLIGTLFVGVTGGGFTPLWGSLIGKLYSLRIYARMMGISSLIVLGCGAFAPLFGGWIHDLTNSYRVLFLTLAGLSLLPIILAPLIRVPHNPNTPEH